MDMEVKIIDTTKPLKIKNSIVYPLGMCCQDIDDDFVNEQILCIGDDCTKKRIITGTFDKFGQAKVKACIGVGHTMAEVSAVIDTGAYYTCINNSIAEQLGAKKISASKSSTPYGVHEMPVYMMNYVIDECFSQNFVSEVRGIDFKDVQMLIGTQFLTQYCEFKYYGRENRFELVINP